MWCAKERLLERLILFLGRVANDWMRTWIWVEPTGMETALHCCFLCLESNLERNWKKQKTNQATAPYLLLHCFWSQIFFLSSVHLYNTTEIVIWASHTKLRGGRGAGLGFLSNVIFLFSLIQWWVISVYYVYTKLNWLVELGNADHSTKHNIALLL